MEQGWVDSLSSGLQGKFNAEALGVFNAELAYPLGIYCEGIMNRDNQEAPAAITAATELRLGLREPTDAKGGFWEKHIRVDFAEMNWMTEPLLIGCP